MVDSPGEADEDHGDARATTSLISELKNTDFQRRKTAAQALGDSGMQAVPAVPSLIEVLKDPDVRVRRAAAETLGTIGDIRAVEPLIASLQDTDFRLHKASAATSLGKLGDPRAVEPLINTFRDSDSSLRSAASAALLSLGAPAVPLLISVLKDPDASVRKEASEILVRIGAPAIEPLLAEYRETDPQKRRAIAKVVDTFDETHYPSIAAFKASEREAQRAVEEAQRKRDENIRSLIAELINSSVSQERMMAAEALGNADEIRAVEPLIAALLDSEAIVRGAAAEALGRTGDIRAVRPLSIALDDTNATVQSKAAAALRSIGAPAVSPLASALNDPDYQVRTTAAKGLGEIGAPAVDSLLNALKDPAVEVRQAAAKALVKLGPPAVGPLIAGLKASVLGEGWNGRRGYISGEIARTLGEIGDARAIGPLIEVLETFDKREQADFSRPFDLRLETFRPSLRSDPKYDARNAVEAIVRIDKSNAFHHLSLVVERSSHWGRVAAAEALGDLRDVNAVRPLCVALGDPENAQLREAAADALVKLVNRGDDRALDPLIAAVRSSHGYVQDRAATALGIIGDPRAIDALTEASSYSNSESVRHSAAAALRQIKNTGKGTR